MILQEITQVIEEFAPLSFQESWDNSGLIIGSSQQFIDKVLLTIDVTETVVDEAIDMGAQLIISHHPVILSGIKRFLGNTDNQRAIIKALKHDIAIYAAHTNMDVTPGGVNFRMGEKLGLIEMQVLAPQAPSMYKLVTFVPQNYFEAVRETVFGAGAGHTGNYDSCGFSIEGKGFFRALEGSRPFVGQQGKLHMEPEVRFETVFPSYLKKNIITALLKSHPYEEPAYDIIALQNDNYTTGLGVIGKLPNPISEKHFLQSLKEIFLAPAIRHTNLFSREIQTVALCGGSGSSILEYAIRKKADVFITADCKYHQFADAAQDILIADIGHFESEQFTKEIFQEILKTRIPDLPILFSKVKTNPINYL